MRCMAVPRGSSASEAIVADNTVRDTATGISIGAGASAAPS